ncbi:hypothetical protein acdb102_18080 [Acidothermaceae bacterium B102]|nr:hypothetical protein acdb102_18080 [Acidothermaceae bacterium B102]
MLLSGRHRAGPFRLALRWLTAAATGAALLAPLPAEAVPHLTTRLAAHAAPATAYVKTAVVVTGTAKPAVAGLTVTLQRFDHHQWHTVAHAKETRSGAYTLSVKASGKVGLLVLRVIRAATKTTKAGVGKTLHVRVVKVRYAVTAHGPAAPLDSGVAIVVTGTVKAKATGSVQLQRLLADTWSTIASAKLTKKSTFSVSTVQPAGSYVLRVAKAFTTKVAGGVTKSFTATVIAPVSVQTMSLPAAATHLPYQATLSATGGHAPYTWMLVSGVLPLGLAFHAAGSIDGRPSTGGTASLTVQVTDATGHTATAVVPLGTGYTTGAVSSWGTNDMGQLGDSIDPSRPVAAAVPGVSGANRVTAGWDTGYALVSGGVVAWGFGDQGQLGNGTDIGYTATAVPVTGLTSGVTAISAKAYTAYALKSDGTVWAWGRGDLGQLGNNTTTSSSVPVQVTGLTGITFIAAGGYSGYALKSDGTVWAWGSNALHQLGDGTAVDRLTPVQVTGLSAGTVSRIAGGGLGGYALKTDGTVWAWGSNVAGAIGDGTMTDRPAAVQVTGLSGVLGVWTGLNQAFALKAGGLVYGWGAGDEGELGNGASADSTVPTPVTISGAVALGAGVSMAYAVMSDHTVRSWGTNHTGELGDGTTVAESLPVTVTGLTNVSALAAGGYDGYALKSDGTVWSWGYDLSAFRDRSVPAPVVGMGGVIAVEGDPGGGAAVKADGTVWDWGKNVNGMLGHGLVIDVSDAPVQVSNLTNMVAVAGDYGTRLALRSDGTVWAWGANADGELGAALPAFSAVPLQVPGPAGVVAIALGGDSGYALTSDGTVWSWGYGITGELGRGTFASSPVPAPIAGLAHVTALAASGQNAYAIDSSGNVWAWGAAAVGQLGTPGTTAVARPTLVPGLSGVTAIAAGGDSAYAVRADGTVVAWGDNTYGQLGIGSVGSTSTPTQVVGVTGAIALAASWDNGYALQAGGTVMAWGHGPFAELGNGSFTTTTVPVAVAGVTGAIAVVAGGSEAFVLK